MVRAIVRLYNIRDDSIESERQVNGKAAPSH
jgi:hypothetical protein